MPDILRKYLATLIKGALLSLSGYLVASGWVSAELNLQMAEWLTGTILTAAWMFYENYHTRQVTLTALTLPSGCTLNDARAKVAEPGPNPSVLTGADDVPTVISR